MAFIRIFDAAKTGMDMSQWKSGFTTFSTVDEPEYQALSFQWLDYDTAEAWSYTTDSNTHKFAYLLADEWGTGMLLREAYYYNQNYKVSFVMSGIDVYVSYADLESGATDWFGFGLGTDDKIVGNRYQDIIKGAGGNDYLKGNGGNDRLFGERGHDLLEGGPGADKLTGGSGRDKLVGGSGVDILIGGGANDLLIGGKGNDVFVFSRGSGNDRIRDFEDGVDHIQIGAGANRFKDLDIVKSGSDTLVKFANVTITVEDTRPGELDGSDFWL